MEVGLDPASAAPLHRQIVDQIRHHIATGGLRPGDRLPPVRLLARQIGVNVNTVAKAYADLEHAGVLSNFPGRGSFVSAEAPGRLTSFREDRLRELLGHALLDALSLGYSLEQIEGALALQWARWRALRGMGADTGGRAKAPPAGAVLRVAGSHDLALDLLLSQLRSAHPDIAVTASNVGSLAGLIALERGEAQVAGCHLLDEETGEYNLPFVRRILPGEPVVLVNLVHRQQGLIVARGNPKGLQGLDDLARADVIMVNRQRGAGTRVLLDQQLRKLDIAPERVRGYQHEVETHTAVAAAVASGSADVGLGILPAARALEADFIPLATERYDLALRASFFETGEAISLLQALRSESFVAAVRELGGYDTFETGQVRAIGGTGFKPVPTFEPPA